MCGFVLCAAHRPHQNPITKHLPTGAKRVLMAPAAKSFVNINNYVQDRCPLDAPTVFIIGACGGRGLCACIALTVALFARCHGQGCLHGGLRGRGDLHLQLLLVGRVRVFQALLCVRRGSAKERGVVLHVRASLTRVAQRGTSYDDKTIHLKVGREVL